MSYAVIVTGGKQYKVAEGEFLKIEKLEVSRIIGEIPCLTQ
ncbi:MULTISPECIES: bL21 family ribosomal protein [unclassified Pseudomonas]